jgi:hypothetical protein
MATECPECGRPIENADARFCPFCQHELGITRHRPGDPVTAAAPAPREEVKPPEPAPQDADWVMKQFSSAAPEPVAPVQPAAQPAGPTPPPRRPRRRLSTKWLAIIIAVVVVAAVAGTTGGVLATRNGAPSTTTTSAAEQTTTTVAIGDTTTASSPENSTTTTTTVEETTTTVDIAAQYVPLAADLAKGLENADAEIPKLADEINKTLPTVPQATYDELKTLLDGLVASADKLGPAAVPPGYQQADTYLKQAMVAMKQRIEATLKGIEVARDSGSDASLSWFKKGSTARDDYRAAMTKYHDSLPAS